MSAPHPLEVISAFEKATGHKIIDHSGIDLMALVATNPEALDTRPPDVPEGKVAVIDVKTGLISHYEDDDDMPSKPNEQAGLSNP